MNKVKAFKIRARKELESILEQNGLLETPLSVRQVEVLAKLRKDPGKLLMIWQQAKDGKSMGPMALKRLIVAEDSEVTTDSYHGLPQEVTTPEEPATASTDPTDEGPEISDLSETDPRILPRKLKLATALHVLENLGPAYRIIRQEGDEAQLALLQRILRRCRDLDHDELQDAITELELDMKENSYRD